MREPDRLRGAAAGPAAVAGAAPGGPGGKALGTLAAALRGLERPVIGRVQEGAVLLGLRCLADEHGFVANLKGLRGAPGLA